jgi:hypothetical protein
MTQINFITQMKNINFRIQTVYIPCINDRIIDTRTLIRDMELQSKLNTFLEQLKTSLTSTQTSIANIPSNNITAITVILPRIDGHRLLKINKHIQTHLALCSQ